VALAQTLTNKTLTSPVINTPTGDVATKTGAQTLTNKTLTSPVINTPTGDVVTKTGAETLTNKTLTTPNIASFANATHDHSGVATGGTIATSMFSSGEYTPTITAVSNVAAVGTNNPCHWHRIGTYITVVGSCTIDPTTAATTTTFRISLPVASNFADAASAQGVVTGGGTEATGGGVIISVAATDDVLARFFPAGNGNNAVGFVFGYKVL
jgi:hypothetical protein